jgi:hypothetical protein
MRNFVIADLIEMLIKAADTHHVCGFDAADEFNAHRLDFISEMLGRHWDRNHDMSRTPRLQR